MKKISFSKKSILPYWVVAVTTLMGLTYTIIDKGKQHPFGTLLTETRYNHLSELPPSSGLYEIIYVGQEECEDCLKWRQVHLPIWRQYDMSQKVTLVMNDTEQTCIENTASISICTISSAHPKGAAQPAFSLIDTRSGKIIKTGYGIDSFYKLSEEAAKRIRAYETEIAQTKSVTTQDKA